MGGTTVQNVYNPSVLVFTTVMLFVISSISDFDCSKCNRVILPMRALSLKCKSLCVWMKHIVRLVRYVLMCFFFCFSEAQFEKVDKIYKRCLAVPHVGRLVSHSHSKAMMLLYILL